MIIATMMTLALAQPQIQVANDVWSGRRPDVTGISVGELYAALSAGPTYDQAPVGPQDRTRVDDRGVLHPYFFVVPETYDPSRRYEVRFFLHGGIAREFREPERSWWERWEDLASEDYISVFPSGWAESRWWHRSQWQNMNAILRDLKSEYNVDENRVFMIGVSDGGTGAFFYAFRDPTPWAGFVSMIGHAAVLANPRVGADGEMYVANLMNRPILMFNGEVDRLYPVSSVRPFLSLYEAAGVDYDFIARPEGHTVSWWPEEADRIEDWVESHPRDPLPDSVVWETERAGIYNRMAWVVIDELGRSTSDQSLSVEGDFFPKRATSGRIDVTRRGNEVNVLTRYVEQFTLLVSPEMFDLSQPLVVTVNGEDVLSDMVESSVDVLLDSAMRDRDRTALYVAEISISVP